MKQAAATAAASVALLICGTASVGKLLQGEVASGVIWMVLSWVGIVLYMHYHEYETGYLECFHDCIEKVKEILGRDDPHGEV